MLPKEEAHHATRVLRLRPGDQVRVFDGRGREWAGRMANSDRKRDAVVVIDREIVPVAEPPVSVTLAVGLLKGDQMDAVVRDATALGVAAIAPMVTAHVTVPERAWKSGAARERWQRVAVASVKQSGRAVVPAIEAVASFDAVLNRACETKFMCVEPGATGAPDVVNRGISLEHSVPRTALVFVGPEGGWSAGEIDAARAAGVELLSFGARTLRAETMPVVVLSALWSRFGW